MLKVFIILFLFLSLFSPVYAEHVAFVAFGSRSIEHFKDYAAALEEGCISTVMIGKESACKAWKRGVNIQDLDCEQCVEKIISECSRCKVVILDVPDLAFCDLAKKLKEKAPFAKRLLYYDHPEAFVPGEYSEVVAKMCNSPLDGILFANLLLSDKPLFNHLKEEIDLSKKKRWALGYGTLDDVDLICSFRSKKEKSQKLTLLYVGDTGQIYIERVIPHFAMLLSLADPLENVVIKFQQHPRARLEGSLDLEYFKKFALVFEQRGIEIVPSKKSLLEAAAESDFVLYSQSAAAPKFYLAGLPLLQISPLGGDDILVREKLVPSITTPEEFIRALGQVKGADEEAKRKTLGHLGFAQDWKNRLITIIKSLESS